MPFIKLQFRPGVNRDQTDYSNEGGWWSCDKIRFRSGFPEKIGGWVKATAMSFLGICRQMTNWVTSYSDNFLGLGTNLKLYIEVGGSFYDITPLRATTPTMSTPNTDNCINTTNGSATIVVALGAAHSGSTGNYVTIAGATGGSDLIGGVPIAQINANHAITVINSTAFSVVVATTASATVAAAGGTAITISFEIDTGYAITTAGYGWGTGTWSRGAWGLGSTSPINLPQRDWWLDNIDNDLVCNIRNGVPYYWARGTDASSPVTALGTRAITLGAFATSEGYTAAAVPVKVMQLLVSQQDKHVIAFGAVPLGSTSDADFDPLLIRWSDQDNPGQWTPAVTNSAGDIKVSRGSAIVRALPTRQEILVWTNSNLYSLQFLGTSDVFGVQEYADNVSIISPRACATASNVTYWMGQDKFYAYTGRVETLPCTLRNHVFQDINLNQVPQIVCGTNEQWNEVWWFYPTADSDYNNAYVVYNHLEQIWYYGTIERTAWLDTSLRSYPQAANSAAAGSTGYIYNQEDGIDDDGSAMEAYIQSSDFDLGDGDQFMLSRRILPDIQFSGSTADEPEVSMVVRTRNFPGSEQSSGSGDTERVIQTAVGSFTNQCFIRARARQMALKIISENLGVNWQVGNLRLDVRPDGRRS